MPKDTKLIEIMAHKKGSGRNTRYRNVEMREDADVDRCLVSEKVAELLLEDGKPEPIAPETVYLSDGKIYSCTAKFGARWCRKDEPETYEITLYVTQGIKEGAIFPKDWTLRYRGSVIAPVEQRPKTLEQKKKDTKRDKEAKKITQVTVQENRNKKKEALINAAKKP